jgi:hypothetical protein
MSLDGKSFGIGFVAMLALCTATVLPPVSRIERERDAARATIEQQRDEILQLQGKLAAVSAERDTFQGMLMLSAVNQRPVAAPAASQSSPLELLNMVRPGLGTLAVAADRAVKSAQAGQCPPGSEPQTSPAWQGAKCVEVTPRQ